MLKNINTNVVGLLTDTSNSNNCVYECSFPWILDVLDIKVLSIRKCNETNNLSYSMI